MSRVFVVQNTMRLSDQGKLEPKFDFTKAEQFGSLHTLLGGDASPFDLPPVIKTLQEQLHDFSKQDYLLLVGSPVLIGLAVAIAADVNDGHIAMLQWSGARRTYIPARAFIP